MVIDVLDGSGLTNKVAVESVSVVNAKSLGDPSAFRAIVNINRLLHALL